MRESTNDRLSQYFAEIDRESGALKAKISVAQRTGYIVTTATVAIILLLMVTRATLESGEMASKTTSGKEGASGRSDRKPGAAAVPERDQSSWRRRWNAFLNKKD